MRRISIWSIATLLGVFLSIVATAVAADEIGVVKDLRGEVTIKRGANVVAAEVGSGLFLGDLVETGEGSAMGAILSDGTVISLGENASLALERYRFEPGESVFDLIIRVLSGRFVYSSGRIGEQAPDKVRIETPRLTVGTQGTRFAVIVPQPAP
jgi:hypothetical protein